MGSLSGRLRRILRLSPRIARAANSSTANTAANIEQTGKDAKTAEQSGDDAMSFLETLPAIDSITATTDIRAFLKPGVPDGLKHAALRQAWATDPAIRDFVGIAENQWDFNKPQNIPGFGLLDPSQNIQRMVAALSSGRSTESQNVPEQQPVSQQTLDNVAQVAGPDIKIHPAPAEDGQTSSVAKPEDRRQNDV
jgi:hypothetical protein